MGDRGTIDLETGWRILESGTRKLISVLEGNTAEQVTAEEFMNYYK